MQSSAIRKSHSKEIRIKDLWTERGPLSQGLERQKPNQDIQIKEDIDRRKRGGAIPYVEDKGVEQKSSDGSEQYFIGRPSYHWVTLGSLQS